jgi:hypothetical protein
MGAPSDADIAACFDLVEDYALKRLQRGDKRISMDMLWGDAQRDGHELPGGNDPKPYVARRLRDRHPALVKRIRIATLGGGGKHKKRTVDLDEIVAGIERSAKKGLKLRGLVFETADGKTMKVSVEAVRKIGRG